MFSKRNKKCICPTLCLFWSSYTHNSLRFSKWSEHFYISMWVFILKFTSGNGRKWFSALCKCGVLIAGWWWWWCCINVFASTVSLIIDVKYDSTPVAASMCLLVHFMTVRKSGFVGHCAPQKSEFEVRKWEEPRQPQVCSTAAPSTEWQLCVLPCYPVSSCAKSTCTRCFGVFTHNLSCIAASSLIG